MVLQLFILFFWFASSVVHWFYGSLALGSLLFHMLLLFNVSLVLLFFCSIVSIVLRFRSSSFTALRFYSSKIVGDSDVSQVLRRYGS